LRQSWPVQAWEDGIVALAGLKAMLAGAVRDRVAAAGVLLVAGILLLTAWVLAVMALVVFVSTSLGQIGGLLAVAGALVLLALLIVWITSARNRRTAELRATTRALWAATAVNAASTILRGDPHGQEGGSEQGGSSHRSVLLIVGGLAMMLLALLVPWGQDKDPEAPRPGPGDST